MTYTCATRGAGSCRSDPSAATRQSRAGAAPDAVESSRRARRSTSGRAGRKPGEMAAAPGLARPPAIDRPSLGGQSMRGPTPPAHLCRCRRRSVAPYQNKPGQRRLKPTPVSSGSRGGGGGGGAGAFTSRQPVQQRPEPSRLTDTADPDGAAHSRPGRGTAPVEPPPPSPPTRRLA